ILRTASGANSTFLSGLNSATIQAGGLVLDATTDVTIAQVLKGTGALVKSNSATVTLTGANTYTGNTKIEGGKLILQTGQNNATTVQVGNGTELVVNLKTAGSTLSVAGLDFNGASSLSFDFGTSANPTAPLIHATSLSVSNTVSVSIANGVLLTTGRIVLIDYDGTFSGDSLFTVGSLPTGMSASITNNTTDGSIDLIITGIPGFLWTGATDSRWNISTTTNWIDQQTASPSAFKEGFLTEFHDGAVTGLVNLEGIITPSFIIVSNDTLPYVWSGGGLTVSSLRKNGTNSLTRVESGADFITDIELNAGSLIVSNIQSATYATVLTDISAGTGTFVKQGPSALTITSTNSTYDGAFIISEGTIKAGADRALGSTNGGTIIANGATLDVNDFQPGFETVIVSGAGVGGAGAIVDTAPGAGSVDANLRDVRMVGDTTLGSPGNTRWDIRVRSGTGPGPGLQGNGFNLTKAGAGFVSIACQRSLTPTPYWDMNLGDVVVNAGTLALAESVTFGNATNHATNTITVNSGAALQLFDLGQTNPILRNIFITDANLNCHGGSAGSNVINSSISLTGAVNFKSDQATFIINGPIIGSGSLAFSAVEPGRLYLNGTNTYPGDTVVTNGGFGGTGSIAGNLVILGGTNSPGMNVGTFTVNGNAALGGTTFMELNRSQSPNSDRLVVGGNLTFAGTLSVVLGAGASAPQAGDVYTLFNKGGTGTFTSVTLPDLSALPGSLSWNTNNLTVNGTISVNGTVASPRIDGVGASGGIFSMSGTGGIEGNSYTILSATNVALPILNWTPLVTNVFGPGGTFGFTNSMDPSAPASFYVLRIP
ncbi:MAG: Autotransporter-associated beta strand repeat protein, partial [Verrucomicrobiales bacterium]|nr:Autotransporter-associated beta strand repeat protein [Verrucomicrobiales bacterium]